MFTDGMMINASLEIIEKKLAELLNSKTYELFQSRPNFNPETPLPEILKAVRQLKNEAQKISQQVEDAKFNQMLDKHNRKKS
jgi:hypothetical protein